MFSTKSKLEAMLFEYGTTYKTDYHGDTCAEHPTHTTPPLILARPAKKRPEKEILKDIHTMAEWKTQVPFTLWHRPKEIVRGNPYEHLKSYVFKMASTEEDRRQAQKTRPRLLITPAGAIDDLDDEERQKMIDHIYFTSTEESLRTAVPEKLNIVSPLPGTLAPSRPFQIATVQPPYVSPEWRWGSLEWDTQQLRSEITRNFWSMRPKPKCRACDETAIVAEYRKRERDMQRPTLHYRCGPNLQDYKKLL